ncbi:ankyrin, partial [Coprinopsis marcescibilis]
MGSLFSKPETPPVARKPRKRARLCTEGNQHSVPAAQVLHGAHGVKFNNSSVTVAGGDVNNYYNNGNSINYSTPGSAASTDADKALLVMILKYLGELNFRGIYDENLAKKTPDTGRAVIDSEWFQEWLMHLLGGIVWATGMPGAGKTILACIVIEYIQKRIEESKSQDICLLFAFCRYTERLMVIDILLAILRQLLERHPQVLPYVKPMYERHEREKTRPSEAEVVELLRQIATSGLFKQTFYILDGLDEAASDIQVDLLEILSSLPVNFFITSRPLDSIKDLVPSARFITVIASDPDIALLIDQKIHRMPVLRKLLMNHAALKAEVVSIISSKSSGMFLLASLHLDMLKECASESDIRNALECLPQGMDGMYDKTMDRIKALPGRQADLAKRVLIWVTYAQRPLTIEELVLAVSVCPVTFRFDEKMEPAGIDSILSLCCGLVQVEATTEWYRQPRNVVRFVHYSTAEYLTKRMEAHYPDDPHSLIASTCISFLRHYGFQDMWSQCFRSINNIWDRLISLDGDRTSMASYPYDHWALHATKSKTMPAPALAFIADCTHYPACYHNESTEYKRELPSFPDFSHSSCQVDTLQSVQVAALYGIREYFNRLEPTSTTRFHTSTLNSFDSGGSTPLILASMAGREDVVAFLLDIEGVRVNPITKDRGTALFVAVANRHAGVVKTILSKRGVNVNRRSQRLDQDSPLTLASQTGQRDVVQLLLETEGIDTNLRNGRGETALYLAIQKGHQDIVKMLLQSKGTNVLGAFRKGEPYGYNASRPHGLMPAILLSGAITSVLNSGTLECDFNAKDNQGCSALAYSLDYHSSTEVAQALLQIPGIDVNSADKDGTTILMLASHHRTDAPRLVETIVKLGGTLDINAKDTKGQTALTHAASGGSSEAVTMLLGVERIDHNCVDAHGETAL